MSVGRVVKDLAAYLRGWRGYFGFGQWPRVLEDLDGWVRHRLRSYLWKHWRRGRVRFRELTRLGVGRDCAVTAAGSARGPWPQSATRAMHEATPAAYWDALGLPRLAAPPTA